MDVYIVFKAYIREVCGCFTGLDQAKRFVDSRADEEFSNKPGKQYELQRHEARVNNIVYQISIWETTDRARRITETYTIEEHKVSGSALEALAKQAE